MTDINWERLVVVVALHGEKYLGWIPAELGDPKKYVEERGLEGKPIRLEDSRNLIGQASPKLDSRGNLAGFTKFMLLMPLDTLNGPMPSIYILPSSWYFPGDHGEVSRRQVEELLKHAVETEDQMKAAAAGLHLASVMPRKTQ
jgi:hypothetical protein